MALKGIKVIELAGLAPGPFCGMILADFGAKVIRVERPGSLESNVDYLGNGKQSLTVNLKTSKGTEVFRKLCKTADVLIDTYRAGVMENLGLGPKVLMADNPKLIFTRLSGFGQKGYFASRAGHDINYIAVSGVLSMLGKRNQPPFPPINLLADFAGGGLTACLGIMMALFERASSGLGQVIDSNMVEGSAYLASWLFRSQKLPIWGNDRGNNVLDGGAPFYNVYQTKDKKFMAVGAIEYKFYENFLNGLGLSIEEYQQFGNWDEQKKVYARKFLEKTQSEWCAIFDNIDACVTPVINFEDAGDFQHNKDRDSFVPCSDFKFKVPAPAPKLSRTSPKSNATLPHLESGTHTKEILESLNYSETEICEMEREGVIEILRKSKL